MAARHLSMKGTSASYISRWRTISLPVKRSSTCRSSSSIEPK